MDGIDRKIALITVAFALIVGSCAVGRGCTCGRPKQEFDLVEGKTHVTRYGIEASIQVVGYKKSRSGSAMVYELSLAHGKRSRRISYTHPNRSRWWFMQGIALGYVYTVLPAAAVDHPGGPLSELVFKSDPPKFRVFLDPTNRNPLSGPSLLNAAKKLAKPRAKEKGCRSDRIDTVAQGGGGVILRFVRNGKTVCEVLVAPYTRKVFLKRTE